MFARIVCVFVHCIHLKSKNTHGIASQWCTPYCLQDMKHWMFHHRLRRLPPHHSARQRPPSPHLARPWESGVSGCEGAGTQGTLTGDLTKARTCTQVPICRGTWRVLVQVSSGGVFWLVCRTGDHGSQRLEHLLPNSNRMNLLIQTLVTQQMNTHLFMHQNLCSHLHSQGQEMDTWVVYW